MFVSVITVTYNRSKFIPALLDCYRNQLYPHASTEWLILDDSLPDEQAATQAHISTFASEHSNIPNIPNIPNIRYIQSSSWKPMGAKLNYLTKLCRGDLIVIMDDDDFYPPTRISSVVDAFYKNPTIEIAGCSKVYMYFQDEDAIYSAGPYHNRHALHCTMAYRSTYLKTHTYDDKEVCAIEGVFTNGFTEPMIQLDPRQTILHMVHGTNTYQKKQSIGKLRKTSYSLSNLKPPS